MRPIKHVCATKSQDGFSVLMMLITEEGNSDAFILLLKKEKLLPEGFVLMALWMSVDVLMICFFIMFLIR